MTKNNWRVSEDEIKYIKKAIKDKLTGKYLIKFEIELAKKFKNNYAIAVNSGTSALHAALYALGQIKPGDEVTLSIDIFSNCICRNVFRCKACF